MADEQKNGTIYQQLNKMLNLDGFGFQNDQPMVFTKYSSKRATKDYY